MEYRLAIPSDIDDIYNIQIETYKDPKFHEIKENILDIIDCGLSFVIINDDKTIIGYMLIHYISDINKPGRFLLCISGKIITLFLGRIHLSVTLFLIILLKYNTFGN